MEGTGARLAFAEAADAVLPAASQTGAQVAHHADGHHADGSRRPPATAAGERLYAIGDIHGCYDLWLDLLARIEDHARALPPGPRPRLILLGDLVDRGPASRQVLHLAYEAQRQNGDITVLLGNHELMMLDAVSGRRGAMELWLRSGGRDTLRSLGIIPPSGPFSSKALVAHIRETMPAEWLEWLQTLPLSVRSGDYFFCHAGVRPGIAIKRQIRRDLLWIREEFVRDAGDHGLVIVHGHSIARRAEVRHNRIGIDTGAYHSGELSALYLEGTSRALLSTRLAQPMPLPQTVGSFLA
jgi:serine/threonine protein phosphatase 1